MRRNVFFGATLALVRQAAAAAGQERAAGGTGSIVGAPDVLFITSYDRPDLPGDTTITPERFF